ncbi:P-loop NTPase family protein [Micromonospora zhanjiangensis]|uniref:Uncharacterized protein n=1 Tax=Micromonospora zhanjiangensis TaxID=1522057 RepID=A0ABV8KN47_9ACTN
MHRIAITGCGNRAKSALDRQLAQLLDAPLTHLDAIYHDKHWTGRDANALLDALRMDVTAFAEHREPGDGL